MGFLQILGAEESGRILREIQQEDHDGHDQDSPRVHAGEINDGTDPTRLFFLLTLVIHEPLCFRQRSPHPGHTGEGDESNQIEGCLLYTSPSPRDA